MATALASSASKALPMDTTVGPTPYDGPPRVCLPGQRVWPADELHLPGPGAYERRGYIHASLAGVLTFTLRSDGSGAVVVGVRAPGGTSSVVPAPGDVVTARVQRLGRQMCRCVVLAVGETALGRPYRAVLRREDARAQDKDKVEMYRCFRPGDVLLAKVLPITEANTYQLTTAENELGVVIAHSQSGHPMVPISWTEMQCPKTFVKEPRKVAKVPPENIT